MQVSRSRHLTAHPAWGRRRDAAPAPECTLARPAPTVHRALGCVAGSQPHSGKRSILEPSLPWGGGGAQSIRKEVRRGRGAVP